MILLIMLSWGFESIVADDYLRVLWYSNNISPRLSKWNMLTILMIILSSCTDCMFKLLFYPTICIMHFNSYVHTCSLYTEPIVDLHMMCNIYRQIYFSKYCQQSATLGILVQSIWKLIAKIYKQLKYTVYFPMM